METEMPNDNPQNLPLPGDDPQPVDTAISDAVALNTATEAPGLTFTEEPDGQEATPAPAPVAPQNQAIVFTTTEQVEMLKIAPEGFYVRGLLVPRDANEAFVVYNAFIEFLVKTGSLKRS
jgi:hypothetical protein